MPESHTHNNNTEIWSTRVQRELLALSSDVEGGGDVMAVLPPFITLKDQECDVAAGICRVSFAINIPGVIKPSQKEEASVSTTAATTEGDATAAATSELQPTTKETTDDSTLETTDANTTTTTTTTSSTTSTATIDDDVIVVTLDASLPRKSDGSIDYSAGMYPFQQPLAILKSGATRFPPGSTVQNGNLVDIDCDWTPSLHFADAAVNVGLKMKESVLQQEPFHAAQEKSSSTTRESDPVEEIVQSARRFGSNLGRSIRSTLKMPDTEGSKQQAPPATTPAGGGAPRPKPKRTARKSPSSQAAAATSSAAAAPTPTHKTTKANPLDIKIGDEINLLESPWVECRGVYSCKAIRRPEFVEDAIAHAASLSGANSTTTNEVSHDRDHDDDGEVPEHLGTYMRLQAGAIGQAANVGFAGAGAMFRSLTQTARSVLEEYFIMITDTHVIELKSSKLNLSTGTITFCIAIDLLAKLKFRRQESISLFFKPAPDDPLIYMCPDSGDVVNQIQTVLKEHGVKGKHTNAAMNRLINEALQIVQHIQTKELALKHDPNVERVNEIMDLYRQAAERFEVAGDVRHEEVVTHMRRFLALPLTASILDGSFQAEDKKTDGSSIPQGEVLERTSAHLDDDDDVDDKESKEKEKLQDKVFEENMDNLMKEAKEDLAHLNIDDQAWNDDDLDAMLESSGGAGSDSIEDLDAMLNAADKELADLMKS